MEIGPEGIQAHSWSGQVQVNLVIQDSDVWQSLLWPTYHYRSLGYGSGLMWLQDLAMVCTQQFGLVTDIQPTAYKYTAGGASPEHRHASECQLQESKLVCCTLGARVFGGLLVEGGWEDIR